jgi:arginyl-tRNA synthetase
MSLREQLQAALGQALDAVMTAADPNRPHPRDIVVEPAARTEFGDYTTNVAMRLAGPLRMPPRQVAEHLRRALAASPWLMRVDVAGPGYLNLWINWEAWLTTLADSVQNAPHPEKVVVEHTSVNPNKAAHIGHLRNACIGDSVVRILRRAGYRVEVHNYIDDLGKQVADTMVGLLHLPEDAVAGPHARFSDYCWDIYAAVHRAYADRPELVSASGSVLHALEQGQNRVAWLGEVVVQRIVAEQLQDMARFGIAYDLLVHESDILRRGLWQAAAERLATSPRFVREESGPLAGCWVLKQETDRDAAPDEEHIQDKVLVRSNGVLTYTGKDIAYHLWKFGLLPVDFRYHRLQDALYSTGREDEPAPAFGHADRVVNVIDRRQDYPQQMVRLALATAGFQAAADALHHISYGVVSLSRRTAAALGIPVEEGRNTYPMAGRQGIGIKVTDLLDVVVRRIDSERSRSGGLSSVEIAAGAIRYYLLRHHLQTEIVFDTEAASDIRGNTGPYLMYAHARTAGILRRAGGHPLTVAVPETLEDVERLLLTALAEWPDRLQEAAAELNPTAVANYVYKLADTFSQFYEHCPILRAEEPRRTFRLILTHRVKATLADALGVLGVPAPEEM